MKKKLGLSLLVVLSLFAFAGCSFKKKALTSEEFIKIAEENNLITESVKESQFSDYDIVKDVIVALNTEGWQLEYYILSTEDDAKSMYKKNESDFDEEDGTKTNIEVGNYTKYTKKGKDYYMILTRVDNTVLYGKVPVKNKDNVDKIIDALGY